MSGTSQRWLLWTGVVLSLIYFYGYAFLMHFLPPPSPLLSAQEVAQLYAVNNLEFKLGAALMILTGGWFLPWTVVISVQMAREEKGTPIWAITQALTGTLGTALLFLPAVFWEVASFSPERDPAVTKIMHELGFLSFVTPVSVFPMQMIAIGIVGLKKKVDESKTAFPSWLGWFSLWMAISAEVGIAALFFKSGPFAWNVIPFYFPIVIFGVWIGTVIYTTLRAIRRQEAGAEG